MSIHESDGIKSDNNYVGTSCAAIFEVDKKICDDERRDRNHLDVLPFKNVLFPRTLSELCRGDYPSLRYNNLGPCPVSPPPLSSTNNERVLDST